MIDGQESDVRFMLDEGMSYLNHGSFGACVEPAWRAQTALREQLERQPVRFMTRELPALLDASRERLAELVNADVAGLVFVENATTAVNTVLQRVALGPGDELVVTDHGYGACNNAAEYVAKTTGAELVVARVPFPVSGDDEVVAAVLGAVTERTRLVLVDHVTSMTGLVLPVGRIAAELSARGVDTLVDGAHAVGMLPLDLRALGAAYYTSNAHKWLCAPKGCAFLYVREDRRDALEPLVISHGYHPPAGSAAPRLHAAFDWPGTRDFTGWAAVGAAIDGLEGALPGGLPALMARNHALACAARRVLAERLDLEPPCPESMLGALAALP
ncbi:MAG: aminotransferase class V-fold PLP-dependent enzyme, partial [Myxococcales bacterium]|nr:aminotransferase class V-fold PLP-dependent enzyme [Myxococcales bacterium]